MTKVKLIIKKSGLYTTIQDSGRSGFQSMGVPVSGPMDRNSAELANQIVGNKSAEPVIEITLHAPEIELTGNCIVAITGADLSAKINGESIDLNKAISAQSGDTLTFGKPIKGARAYLAVLGDWKIKKWLGSASPAPIESEALTPNSVLKKDSIIEIDIKNKKVTSPLQLELTEITNLIEVSKGPEFSAISEHCINHLLNNEHVISSESNRMGYKLESRLKDFETQSDMISSGIIPGTVQLTTSGQPIILLADSQTIGGYPRVLVVRDHALDSIGQLKPGDTLQFVLKDKKNLTFN